MLIGMTKRRERFLFNRAPKRRWPQFSLGSLFLLTTLIGIGLALLVVPAENRRRVVAEVKALHGEVSYAAPPKKAAEERLRPPF